MSLPEFNTVSFYANGDGDLPQRFYMTPELESLSDCVLVLDEKKHIKLPVHSQILALRSGTFKEMLANTSFRKNRAIPFFGHDMLHMLICLRFAYDDSSLTKDNVNFITTNEMLPEAMRAVHALDLESAPTMCTLVSNNIGTLSQVCTVFEASKRFDDANLMTACYTAALKWYRSKRGRCVMSEAFQSVASVRQCPELMQAILMYSLYDDHTYEGVLSRRLFGSPTERIPDATYTWFMTKHIGERLTRNPKRMSTSQEFAHAGTVYKLAIRHNNDLEIEDSAYSSDDDIPEQLRNDSYNVHVHLAHKTTGLQHVSYTLRLLNLNTGQVHREETVRRGKCVYERWSSVGCNDFMTDGHLRESSEDSGVVAIQIVMH